MSRWGIRLCAVAAVAALAAAAVAMTRPSAASAHPLGNFTINHYDRIDVSDTGIEVYSVLDMAEIPTFRERQQIDTNGDGTIEEAESGAYAAAKAQELRANLVLRVNGETAALTEVSHELTFPAGQGGLSLLRLTATYRAALPEEWRGTPPRVEFEDHDYADRLGWREIVVRGGAGVEIDGASVPSQDVSAALTAYPQGALSSPLDVRSGSFSFKPGAGVAPAPTPDHRARAVRGNPDSPLARFANLIAKDHLSFGVVVLALLAAMGFGAIHALSPGHGKTIVAAYLIGSKGTARHALLLGLTVTATHTSSVYALGFMALYLSEYVVPERLYPWLGIASGGLIVAMGLTLLVGRLRSSGLLEQAAGRLQRRISRAKAMRAAELAIATGEAGAVVLPAFPAHRHGAHARGLHDREDHGHEHAHDHGAEGPHDHRDDDQAYRAAMIHRHGMGPAHSHAIPGQDGEPVTWRRLVGLGIFGGLLPCPSAIVVMLSAISLHRVGFGLVLIVAFSLGLAGVLTGIGFALVFAGGISERLPILKVAGRRAERRGGLAALAVRAFPVASAAAVACAGALVAVRAMAQQGFF